MKKILFLLVVVVILVGCSEEEETVEFTNPYDYLHDYISLWEQSEFQDMYDQYLLERTKAEYTFEDYGTRYEHLYDTLEVDQLSVEILEEQEITEEDFKTLTSYEVPVSISFQTLAGEVDYRKDVVLEKQVDEEYVGEGEVEIDPESPWHVEWDPSFILPNLEDGDEVRLSSLPAQRGEIVDRNGQLMATNGEVYELGVVLENFHESSLSELANILDLSEDSIKDKYEQSWVQPHHFVPIIKLSLEEKDLVTQATSIDGVTSRISMDRVYPFGKKAAHLTGYIGSITAEELEELEGQGYSSQDRIGKRGLEQLYDEQLRGEEGVEIYIEKTDQSTVTVAKKDAKDGETVQLTIDMNIQEKLYDLLKEENGTAMTMNPLTGEVTSLISFPAFDPNRFVLGLSQKEYNALMENENRPTINRFASSYSPGSTAKLMTTAIGLNQGVLEPEEQVTINGSTWQKDASWGNYYVSRVYTQDTQVDLESAIVNSDNIYFAMLGTNIGGEQFRAGLERLGFGEDFPFEYPVNQSQISNSGSFDHDVLLADTSYGQGQMLMNMVHLTSLYSGVVNNGDVMTPLLTLNEEQSVLIEDMVSEDQASLLQQLFRKVVSQGTAQSINLPNRQIAGKTGTAELKSSQEEDGVENGIFVSYDQSNPEMILTILIEGVQDSGGSGYVVELAKKFYE